MSLPNSKYVFGNVINSFIIAKSSADFIINGSFSVPLAPPIVE